ncbi:MAG: ArnT family glycosyltransferase, partial [Longimicrobiales bacterium]
MRTEKRKIAFGVEAPGAKRSAVKRSAAKLRALPLWALLAVIVGGCALRLVDLGNAPLRNDELNHYYVARSIERGDDPVLPSGEWYLRGIDYTRLVGLTLDRIEPTELAVRLPSALLGCLGLVLFASIAWVLVGPWAAVIATLLFALYPEAIHQSRSGRFYTMQLLYGLSALYAGWRALGAGLPREQDGSRWNEAWAWTLVTIAALLLAARVQVVTLSGALAWAVCVAATAASDVRAWKAAALRWSVPLQLTMLAVAASLVFVTLRPDAVTQGLVRALAIPHWASAGGFQNANYIGFLTQNMPIVVGAGSASLYYVARRKG